MTFFKAIDWWLFLLISLIIVFGSAILISIGAFNFPQHLFYLIFAFTCFFVFSRIDYRIYKNFDVIFYTLSLCLLLLTFVFGKTTQGAVRWLNLGFISFQPSELLKPWLILSLVNLGLKFNLQKMKDSFLFSLIFTPVFILIFKQPDLGNAVIYLVIFLSVFYMSRGRLWFLLLAFLAGGLLSPLIWHFLQEYQKQRIISFINPVADPLGVGYNLIQAVLTVGSGRFLGRGLGIGTQSTLRFLPERATDFIFASLAEEVGFIGCFIFLFLFFLLLLKILLQGFNLKDDYAKNIILAVFAMIFGQMIINIGMNLGMLPITGITLPLISQGGSSLLAMMISLGIVNNILMVNKKS